MKDFIYDKEQHIGTYKGKRVPSITQLLSIIYPLGNIKSDVLAKASERGTKVHNDIERYNNAEVFECETREGKNYAILLEKLGVEVDSCEQMVFVLDNDEVIAFGTYDLILKPTENSLLEKPVLADIKTISDFDNVKVATQLAFYDLALKSMGDTNDYDFGGLWLRGEIAQYRPLVKIGGAWELFKNLIERWKIENGIE